MMNEFSDKEYCSDCGNHGQEGGCPTCGRQENQITLQDIDQKEVKQFLSRSSYINIPEQMIGVDWSKAVFWESKPSDMKKDKWLQTYVDSLDKVHDMFRSGLIYGQSLMVISPPTFSKETWAFSCMQNALFHKHSVAPLLDTFECKRLLVLSGENPHYKLNHKYGYDDWITADVMFVSITKTQYCREASFVIRELLTRRSRQGLGVIFLSEYPIDVLNQAEGLNQDAMQATGLRINKLKYPALIEYMPKVGRPRKWM